MQSGIRWKMPRCVWKTSRLVPPSHQPLGDKEDSENSPPPLFSLRSHTTRTHAHVMYFTETHPPLARTLLLHYDFYLFIELILTVNP